MKLFMGFIILLVALVAITGCTQTASTPAQTTTETIAPTTEITTVATTEVTTVQTTEPATNATLVANVTAPVTNVTTTVVTSVPVNVTPTVTAASGITTIHITKTGFTPQTDVVLPGTGISWVNDDNVTHSINMIGDNEGMFKSGDILPGATFPYTFSQKTGTFIYSFADNKTITGTIIVKAARSLSG
jgi:plastocyanin